MVPSISTRNQAKELGRVIDANGSKVEYVMEYVTLADMGLGRNVSGTLRQGGRAKMEDALQLSHYRDMLAAGGFGRADEQYGYVIGKALAGLSFVAVRMDLTALVYSAADGTINAESAEGAYKRGFTKAAQIVRNAKDHGIYPRPMVNALCGECVYAPTCEQIWEENDEVTRIAGVTPKIAETKLADLGITTVAELAHLPLGTDKLDKHIDFARVYDAARESGKVYAYRRRGLPSVQIDSRPVALFVDMENSVSLQDELFDPKASQIVYQWGMHLVNYQVDADNKVIGEKYNDVASVKAKHLQFDDFTHTDEGELKVFLKCGKQLKKLVPLRSVSTKLLKLLVSMYGPQLKHGSCVTLLTSTSELLVYLPLTSLKHSLKLTSLTSSPSCETCLLSQLLPIPLKT